MKEKNIAGRRTEWTAPYNSFNSWKGLMYKEHYDALLQGRMLPPVEASIDPSYICNVDCVWCNSRRILHGDLHSSTMTQEHLMCLCGFLIDWGVRGFCFAGGGDSTLNPGLWPAMRMIKKSKCENSIITNGIAVDTYEKQETLASCCRWIGVSLDAGTAETYGKVKQVNPRTFDKVLNNIASMVKIVRENNFQCDIAIKYLIHPTNAHEISKACAIAKDLGVAHFHARPAAAENVGGNEQVLEFPMDIINKQLDECLEMQTDNFKAFGVRHKFAPDFQLEHGFSRCISAPLCIQCGADGKVYLCNDWRGDSRYCIGEHFPNPEQILDFWGSKEHWDLMNRIKVSECPRCTYGIYAKQIENAVENDGMCVNFP